MEDGPPIFSQRRTCADLLNMSVMVFAYGTITLYRRTFQCVLLTISCSAAPRSLAATRGISFDFFSSGYLDVSVLRVRSLNLCIQLSVTACAAGFPHSEIPESMLVCKLVRAYRILQRPSSPLTA